MTILVKLFSARSAGSLEDQIEDYSALNPTYKVTQKSVDSYFDKTRDRSTFFACIVTGDEVGSPPDLGDCVPITIYNDNIDDLQQAVDNIVVGYDSAIGVSASVYVERDGDTAYALSMLLAPSAPPSSGLPPQSGQAGKYLYTDGATASWRGIRAADILAQFAINTFAVSSSTREVGESVTPASFTASYNRTPTLATLTDNYGSLPVDVTSTPTAFSSTGPFTKTTNNDSVTFTLTASDGVDPNAVATSVMRWRPRCYYGVDVNQLSATEAFIESLSNSQLLASRNLTFTVNAGASQHIYYAFPASYGTPTFTVNGFAGGFELVGSVSVTNAYGVTQSYSLYKSTNSNLGSTTVVVT